MVSNLRRFSRKQACSMRLKVIGKTLMMYTHCSPKHFNLIVRLNLDDKQPSLVASDSYNSEV